MSESGNRWEPGEPVAGQPAVAGPSSASAAHLPPGVDNAAARPETPAPQPPAAAVPARRARLSRTAMLMISGGLVIFLAGGFGGYALAVARTSSTGIVPAGFQRQGDGRRSFDQIDPFGQLDPFGQSNPFGQSGPFGQSNPFGSAPQGTTT